MARTDDLLTYLGAVVAENTKHYKEDFEVDQAILSAAVAEPRAEERTFYWMSRPTGTHCVKEREAFLRGTGAHSIWTHYESGNEQFKAYRVVVTGENNGKLAGELYALNYDEQMRRVKANALPVHTVTGTYKDGESYAMRFDEMDGLEAKLEALRHGGISTIHYEPENADELAARINHEHALQKRPLRGPRKRKTVTR